MRSGESDGEGRQTPKGYQDPRPGKKTNQPADLAIHVLVEGTGLGGWVAEELEFWKTDEVKEAKPAHDHSAPYGQIDR